MIRSYILRVCSAMLLLALLSIQIPFAAIAANATPASDTLSRMQIGVQANHEIVFTTPTGVDASSDTITISLPDFTFGSVGVGDLDLFHGAVTGFENPDALAVSAAAGVWGVSVVGTTITFTAPTDAAPGTIPAGNLVAIRIGTNASGGTNRLTNPVSATIATVSLGGTFGDTATMSVPIIGNDQVAVSATVAATSTGGGGGGGGGGGDVTPPNITGVQAVNITTSTATIIWNTDELASSIVEYGYTQSYASGTVSNPAFVTSHSINLSALTPNTTYHFRVQSLDSAGNPGISGDFTFTTLAGPLPPDATAPVISNIQVQNITDTSALITWDTDEPATSVVGYGTTIAYGSSGSISGLVTSHAVQLNGLSPSTLYHFVVGSQDGSGNGATSTDRTFTTSPDVTPPTNVSGLSATPGNTVVSLSWVNPSEPDFAGTRIVRQIGAFPTGPFDGTFVYSGSGTTTVDTGLTNGVTYFYGAYAFDTSGNFASGALASATPSGPPPGPENTDALCSNGIDDDADGAIDCLDSQCTAFPSCSPTPTSTPPTPPPTSTPPTPPPVTPTPTSTPPEVPGPTPTPSPPPGEPGAILVEYYAGGGSVALTPDSTGAIGVLAGSAILVSVPTSNLGATVTGVTFSIGSALYSLQPNGSGTAYSGTFIAPPSGIYTARVVVQFENNTARDVTNVIRSQAGGQVVEETVAGPSDTGVPGATVQLYRDVNGTWVPYGAPQITGPNGEFAFVVPNGRYYVESTKEGYRKSVGVPVTISQNVFNVGLSMIRVPEIQPIPPEAPVQEKAAIIISNAAIQAGYAVQVAREVLDSPVVQQANTVVAPTLLAVTIVNAASAISAFNAFAYLQYLFTQPLLLFGRRRKKQWGVVYNSLTKQPVDLAIVRLLQAETRFVVQTKVTDKEGRYAFLVKKGKYILEVVKPAYVFPTQHLTGKKEDADFVDLYHGDAIEVTEDGILVKNIPLDPITSTETPRLVLWKKTMQTLRQAFAFSGIPVGMITLIISPGVVTGLLLLAQIGVYLLFRRVAVPVKAKSWGVTFDAVTRKPMQGVIVRVFDKKFNKLLETQVTDANGKYGFFVRRNVYYVIADKPGYERYVSPDIDLSDKDQALIAQNIPLKLKK